MEINYLDLKNEIMGLKEDKITGNAHYDSINLNDILVTEVGDFKLEQSISIDDLISISESDKNKIEEKIIGIEELFNNLENIELNKRKLQLFLNGVRLTVDNKPGLYKIYSNNTFIGIGIVKNQLLKRDIIL